MYSRGKWLLHLRNKYGYSKVFTKKVYKSLCGPYDHHDHFKIEVMRGNHDISFDPQKVEIHLSNHKITPKLRYGINHPVCWAYTNGEYAMVSKEFVFYTNPSEWTDEQCILLFFVCIQEISTRIYHYNKYKHKSYGHYKAIFTCIIILKIIVKEAKKRNIYY